MRARLTINNQLYLRSIQGAMYAGSFWVALTQAVQLKRLRNVKECVRAAKEGIEMVHPDRQDCWKFTTHGRLYRGKRNIYRCADCGSIRLGLRSSDILLEKCELCEAPREPEVDTVTLQ